HVHQLLHRSTQAVRGPGPGHSRRGIQRHPQRHRAPAARGYSRKTPKRSDRKMNAKAWLLLLLSCCPLVIGCGSSPTPQGGSAQNPAVLVSLPITKEVTDYEYVNTRSEKVRYQMVTEKVTDYEDFPGR